jgi:hypothetical protein
MDSSILDACKNYLIQPCYVTDGTDLVMYKRGFHRHRPSEIFQPSISPNFTLLLHEILAGNDIFKVAVCLGQRCLSWVNDCRDFQPLKQGHQTLNYDAIFRSDVFPCTSCIFLTNGGWDRFLEPPKLLLFEGMVDFSEFCDVYTSPIQQWKECVCSGIGHSWHGYGVLGHFHKLASDFGMATMDIPAYVCLMMDVSLFGL